MEEDVDHPPLLMSKTIQIVTAFVLSQSTRVTDRRTGRITSALSYIALHELRGKKAFTGVSNAINTVIQISKSALCLNWYSYAI